MSEDLAKLKVTIEGDSKSFKREMSQSEAEAKKACNAIKKAMNNISFKNTAGDKLAAPWKQVGKRIKSTITDIRAGELKESMKDYVKEAQLAAGIRVYTDDYLRIKDDIDRTNKSLEKLQQKKRDLQARKEDTSGIDTQIAATQRQARRYNSDRITMIARGQDTERVTSSKLSSGSGLETAGATASYSLKQIPAKMREITSSVNNTIKRIPVLGKVLSNAAYVGSKGWGGLKKIISGTSSVFRRVSTAIKRTSGAFAALIQKFTSGIPIIGRTRKSMNGIGQSGRGLRGILSTLGMTARFMFASFIIQGALSGAKEGMQNLSKYSKQTNADLSLLMSSLTQLKNSLATAFAPILTVITPVLNALIQKIITVVNAFGQLTASLAGQTTFVKAKKVNQDYAASLDKSSKKAKNLQRTLMGFDEINKLDDKNSSNSSGSGGLSPNDMFETVKIPNKYKDLAKMLKDAWAQGDFTKIGQMVGKKVNEALESIPWDKIKKTCNKIAKSIATFLNGFIETVDWGLVGNTISQGLNTAFSFANTFAKNFHWDSLGKAVGDGINGAMEGLDWDLIQETVRNVVGGIVTSINTFIKTTKWNLVGKTIGNGLNTALEAVYTAVTNFKWKKAGKALADAINGLFDTFDWAKAGKTISNGIKGVLDFAITAIENVKWSNVGKDIATFLENIDWLGIATRIYKLLCTALASALAGLAGLLGKLIGDAAKNAQKYFKKKIEECGGNIPLGILKGIKDGMKNIAKWVKDNIFKPIIDAFKTAFGIRSPSTVMAEQGTYIISGLLKGLKDKIKDVLSWIAKLPGEFKEKLGNAREWLVGKGKDAITGIKNGWNAAKKTNLLDHAAKIKNEIYEKIGDVKGKVTSRGKEVITGLKNGLDNNWKTMNNTLSNLPSKISKAIPNLYKTGKNAIQNFADGFASVKIKLPHISTTWNRHNLGNLSFSTPSFSLNWYAKGGLPDAGEMFVARERGPEMVGRIGNKNAVANNNQIVDAIRAGVFEAMVNALESFGGDKNQNTEVHVYLEGDSKKLFKVVRKEGQQYQKSTGKPVFS